MKFLVDAQLPKSLSDFLNSAGHDSIHTLQLQYGNRSTDSFIIDISEKETRIVISKDGDFLESFLLSGKPEKLVLIRTGNLPNATLLKIFQDNIEYICSVLSDNSLVEVRASEIIAHA